MKKIVINGIHLCAAHSGIQRYTIECLRELDKINQESKLDVEIVYPSNKAIDCPLFQSIKVKPLLGLTRYWNKFTLPAYIRLKDAFFVGMANDAPVGG
ncbi:MAG: hypothetical protein LUH12_12170 [Bacteroides sp.]|nr:hypothetical protein [Bacteroides sp.]